MSLSVRILETPPPHLEHLFSGFIFANFMELIKLREQDDQDAARGIQTRAIRQRLENKSKGQLMLEDFRYWALKYVFEFLCHIEFNLTRGICYYESARVEVYMACGVTARTQRVNLRQPALRSLALPLLKNDNVMRVNDVLQITGLQLAAQLREALPCRIVHAGYEDADQGGYEIRDFSLRDVELAEHVVAAQILDSRDPRLPLLQGLRPVQTKGICRLLIPHTKPNRDIQFDEDYFGFQRRILGLIVFTNLDYNAPRLLEVVQDRVAYVEDLIEKTDPLSDNLRRILPSELHLIATLHNRHKRLEDARTTYQRQIEIFRALNEEESVATILNDLGVTLMNMEKYEEAHDIFQEALVLNERLFGVDSKDVVKTLVNLINTQKELGQLHQARTNAERALRIMETHYYEEVTNLYSAVFLMNAQVLLAIGGAANLNRALTLIEQSITIQIRLFGVADRFSTHLLARIEAKRRG